MIENGSIKARVREFLSRYIRTSNFGDDEDIFALGFVNSLFALQLVMFVESEYGLVVEDEDLELENFKSINAISELVERKTSTVPAP